ncbi:MAG: LuxR family transcriptional regulator [Bacteroidota bacterium]|nr:LuxR family transcriptional regulator [Bacteroidota bacterium]MDP4229961.1 LuxR family transcriptional regulator [Bacteroidota bacterium]MDP4235668.1 LuxR family transcriptional regulator [Bacteroidota bacterium]
MQNEVLNRPDAKLLGAQALQILDDLSNIGRNDSNSELEITNKYLKSEEALQNEYLRCALLSRKAVLLHRKRQQPEAETAFAEALLLSEKLNNYFMIGKIYLAWSEISQEKGQVERTYAMLENAQKNFGKANLRNWEGRALLNLAINYINWGSFEQAPEIAARAKVLLEDSPYADDQACLYVNLGVLYGRLGLYEQALQHYLKALPYAEEVPLHQKIVIYYNIASDLQRANRFEEAESKFREGYSFANNANYAYGKLITKFGLANVIHVQGNISAARSEFISLLELAREISDTHMEQCILHELGHIELKDGNLDAAEIMAKAALEIGEKTKFNALTADGHDLLHRIAKARNNYQTALEEYKIFQEQCLEFHQLEISQVKSQAETRIELKRIEMETDKTRQKAEQLEKDLANSAIHIASQTDLLDKFRVDLQQIVLEIDEPIKTLKKVKAKLKELPCKQIDWTKFEVQFSQVHPEFRTKLANKYPDLTDMEQRIAAMVRMDLKSSDIARLFCITERAVEFHRLNLRKKLNLKSGETLPKFLSNV